MEKRYRAEMGMMVILVVVMVVAIMMMVMMMIMVMMVVPGVNRKRGRKQLNHILVSSSLVA